MSSQSKGMAYNSVEISGTRTRIRPEGLSQGLIVDSETDIEQSVVGRHRASNRF